MKRMMLLVLGVLWIHSVAAQDAGFGAGAAVGSPGGLTAKQWISETQAIAGVLNFRLADEFSYLQLQADLLFHMDRPVAVDDVRLATYVGGGVSILFQDEVDNALFLRAPVGIDAQLTGLRLGMFVEVAPLLRLTDSVSLSLAPGIGARYFFRR